MKSVLKSFVFALISLRTSQYILQTFSFGDEIIKNYIFVSLALGLLYFFLKPVLSALSLPVQGIILFVFDFIFSFIVLFILTTFIPTFAFLIVTTPSLLIFGFMLTSFTLSNFWSGVAGALIISLIYGFLGWLSKGKK